MRQSEPGRQGAYGFGSKERRLGAASLLGSQFPHSPIDRSAVV